MQPPLVLSLAEEERERVGENGEWGREVKRRETSGSALCVASIK